VPMVSFSFDDFPRSALLSGARILTEHGALGTFFVSGSLVGKTSELGPISSLDDLHACSADGHEIGCHTYHHLRSTAVSKWTFEQSMDLNREWITRNVGCKAPDVFAYPYGNVTIRTKMAAHSRYKASRGVERGTNGSIVDCHYLKANPIYGDTETIEAVATIKRLLSETVLKTRWCIFYTHDVSPTPSEYGCKPELLRFAIETALSLGIRLEPVGMAFRALMRHSTGE
jgi:peptidoglycan/xylan/chitin deacetylase (PgdA/CDA1 family)